jgi:phospholipid/cholesterol/gamma-HCH transport system ATP-binding protein
MVMNKQQQHETVIDVHQLHNRFGAHVVHDRLDLSLHRGEILGVVGGSGTGKSVLLRTLIGLRRPDHGTIRLLGESLQELSGARLTRIQQRTGVLFQNGALYSSLTVAENIALPLIEHAGLSRQSAERLASVKLALTGLSAETGARYPAELSGGMVKRAALARALALDPDILFLDEPTAGLDPIAAAAFDQLLLTLKQVFNLSVFLVTHDLDTLYTVCDRVAVLAQQRVLAIGPVDEVAQVDDPWIREYFQGPRGRMARRAAASGNAKEE